MENSTKEVVYFGKNLAKALAIFHKEIKTIKKDSDNPYFKSKYAGLDSILPEIKIPLENAGLVFVQIPLDDNKLQTIITHVESGESITGTYAMKPVQEAIKNKEGAIIGYKDPTPQAIGSIITYMRRYALVAMLGLNTDVDDDGNKGSGKKDDDEEPF